MVIFGMVLLKNIYKIIIIIIKIKLKKNNNKEIKKLSNTKKIIITKIIK